MNFTALSLTAALPSREEQFLLTRGGGQIKDDQMGFLLENSALQHHVALFITIQHKELGQLLSPVKDPAHSVLSIIILCLTTHVTV